MPDESSLCIEPNSHFEEQNSGNQSQIGKAKLVRDIPAIVIEILSDLLLPEGRGDWRALAAELSFDAEVVSVIECDKKPVNALFKRWKIDQGNKATVEQLVNALQKIRRLDCIDDIQAYIVENRKPNQDAMEKQVAVLPQGMENMCKIEHEHYDVFISYAEDDIQFARYLLLELEKKEYKVCIDYRDFMVGSDVFDEIGDIIENRCRKVIVVLSEAFNKCEMNDFQAKLALSRSPSGRKRILLPVLYEPCVIPTVLKIFQHINYHNTSYRKYFWTRLFTSLGPPMSCNQNQLHEN